VDTLFRSMVQAAGADAVALLLTGMGDDGASALLALRTAGATTLAQDEATSIVFGMPRQAIELGAACEILGLSDIAPRLRAITRRVGRNSQFNEI
jgi:two-component system chemotaxis response regulator CheB